MNLFGDIESFSAEPITNGVHKYAESAEVMIRSWALDDGEVLIQDLTPGGRQWILQGEDLAPAPAALVAEVDGALADDSVLLYFHNSSFDRTVERHAGLQIPLHRWRDTMVQALAHSLPGSLGALCEVLRVDTDKAKDKAGKALIMLFCRPIPFRFRKRETLLESAASYKAEKEAAEAAWSGRATRETHPAEWHQFLIYAGRDIIAMRECHKRMPKWNYPNLQFELDLWHLDQEINDRGVAIDLELAECAVRAVAVAQEGLRERTGEITAGEVESTTQVDQLLLHILAQYGVDLPNMQKATIERRVADPDLPEGLRELLRIRLQASSTSTSKYNTLMRCTSADARLRGLLQFLGAARTGRWAGRLFQPQNLPSRGLMPPDEILVGIDALKDDVAHLLFDNVMHLTSSAIRGCIVAAPGKKLVVADLSNIEGRDQAWLAGERWKLKAFREFDAGRGADLYKMAYAKSFNIEPGDVTKEQRQIGKVQELALGYEGGVGAFVTFAANYGIDLDQLAAKAIKFIPGEVMGQARIMLEWHRSKGRDPAAMLKMEDRTWLVCESFKIGWRAGHREIAAYWKQLDAAVRLAIEKPGTTIPCGKVRVRRDGAWLRIVLPSGRALCYPSPALMAERKKRNGEVIETIGIGEIESEQPATGRTKITYMGMNQYTKKWDRLDTYGGKLFENCLTGDTEVLTMAGWLPIEEVGDLPVWDGHEFVEHDGCIYKGKQVVLLNYGVKMTPEHLVLTEEGWKNAPSSKGLNRADVGLPDGYEVRRGGGWAPIYVGGEVPVRHDKADAGQRVCEAAEKGNPGVLWVPKAGEHRREKHQARDERASGVCRLAQYDGSLRSVNAPGVPKLRRQGHHGLRTLARIIRKLLGRHGPHLLGREVDRTQEKRPRLFTRELQVAICAEAGQQQTHIPDDRDSGGADHGGDGRASLRGCSGDAVLPAGPWLAGFEGVEHVYDLVNCGPRHQFVVRGTDGRALIVHNCCQAVARDVMAHNMPAIEAAGYQIVLTVHDEIIAEAPDSDEFNAEHLSSLLAANPPWAEDMPLAAAGFEAYRYKKD